VLSEVLLRA